MPSELEKALAKRRSKCGEDIFESSNTCSAADAGASSSKAGYPQMKEQPPWMDKFGGAVFVDAPSVDGKASADSAEVAGDGLPPWFNAAVEQGIVFYDPEGQEVKIPSSQVGAFKAALETVIEFEPGPCRGALVSVPASVTPDAPNVKGSSGVGAGISAHEGCTQQAVAAETPALGAGAAASVATSSEDAETLRRDNIKANLQKRYFALLRLGLEPNEAAARAILEAAGHAPEEQMEKGRGAAMVAGAAAGGDSTQNNSCSGALRPRSGSGEASSDSRRSTEIVVSA